jgi:hypothetical protein
MSVPLKLFLIPFFRIPAQHFCIYNYKHGNPGPGRRETRTVIQRSTMVVVRTFLTAFLPLEIEHPNLEMKICHLND